MCACAGQCVRSLHGVSVCVCVSVYNVTGIIVCVRAWVRPRQKTCGLRSPSD